MVSDIPEESAASIFRVENVPWDWGSRLFTINKTTWCHTPEHRLHPHHHDNLKFYIVRWWLLQGRLWERESGYVGL